MPEASVLASFVVVSALFALMPGPNVVFLLATSARRGPWSAWRSALGVETATLVFAVLTAAGLGAVIAASTLVFQTLKWAGVAYLCWLGLQAWRAGSPHGGPEQPTRSPRGRAGEFRAGFLLGIANPKVVLFFLAFLPQFVRPGSPTWTQLLTLGILFALVGLAVDAFWCTVAGALRRLLSRRSRPRPWARRGPALAFFGLAGWAATTGQHA